MPRNSDQPEDIGLIQSSNKVELPELDDSAVAHLSWALGGRKGYACLALLDRATNNPPTHIYYAGHQFDQLMGRIESTREENFARDAANEPGIEIFITPLRMKHQHRHKGDSIDQRRLVWVDVDRPTDFARTTLIQWGFWIIDSGTPGNFHAYAKVDRDLTLAQHRAIQEKLVKRFGGDPALVADNAILRPGGTTNYKAYHPKVEKRTDRVYPVKVSTQGKRTISATWLVKQLGGIRGASASTVERVNTAGWESSPMPKRIPDSVIRFVRLQKADFQGDNVDWSGQAYAAALTCVEHGYTDREIHRILHDFEPGVDKYESRSGGWHGHIDLLIEKGRAKQQQKQATDDDFWTRKEWLQHVHRYFLSIARNPKAGVGLTLMHALLSVPPFVQLPENGSLNFYLALVGPSGGGKSRAMRHVHKMIEGFRLVEGVPAGSGQGMSHLFMEKPKGAPARQVRTYGWYQIDEVDAYEALTKHDLLLDSYLRSAWTGEQLGAWYADENKRLIVPANQYRLAVTMGIQPRRAAVLVGRTSSGTPQRFLWLPTRQVGLPTERPVNPGTWVWKGREFREGDKMTVPDSVAHEMWLDEVTRGDQGELDGGGDESHRFFLKLKVAAGFAIMDSRLDIVEDDWNLADVVMSWSDSVFRQTKAILHKAEVEGVQYQGRLNAKQNAATRDEEYRDHIDKAKERILTTVPGTDWVNGGEITKAVRRWAELKDAALDELIHQDGVLQRESTGVTQTKNGEVKTFRYRRVVGG